LSNSLRLVFVLFMCRSIKRTTLASIINQKVQFGYYEFKDFPKTTTANRPNLALTSRRIGDAAVDRDLIAHQVVRPDVRTAVGIRKHFHSVCFDVCLSEKLECFANNIRRCCQWYVVYNRDELWEPSR
jgi:hypothetical protein